MLPCEKVSVSLVDFCNRPGHLRSDAPQDGHCDHHSIRQTASQPLQAHDELTGASHVVENTARVFYLNHPADHSFVEVHFLAQLWSKKHGDSMRLPTLSKDTRVLLRWRFPSMPGMSFTTTHSVLREITFDIILRENDWYEPIMRLWQWEKSRSLGNYYSAQGERGVARDEHTTGHSPSLDEDEMLRGASVASDSGNEDSSSSFSHSPRPSSVVPSSPSACPSDDGHNSGEPDNTFRTTGPPGTDRGERELRGPGCGHHGLDTTVVPHSVKT